MSKIVPADTLAELSAYELALLLLSAHLHDAGMSPRHGLVVAHHEYLLTGDRGSLDEASVREFQHWLDRHHDGMVPPICTGRPAVADLRTANLLVAHYVRFRHIDWGETWTRAELVGRLRFRGYEDVIDDLVLLCRSHGEGYGVLRGDRFNPRFLLGGSAVVHLRYLAAVLRVADVLEIDPERTPEVLFRHRNVAPGSVIYWHKRITRSTCRSKTRAASWRRRVPRLRCCTRQLRRRSTASKMNFDCAETSMPPSLSIARPCMAGSCRTDGCWSRLSIETSGRGMTAMCI